MFDTHRGKLETTFLCSGILQLLNNNCKHLNQNRRSFILFLVTDAVQRAIPGQFGPILRTNSLSMTWFCLADVYVCMWVKRIFMNQRVKKNWIWDSVDMRWYFFTSFPGTLGNAGITILTHSSLTVIIPKSNRMLYRLYTEPKNNTGIWDLPLESILQQNSYRAKYKTV